MPRGIEAAEAKGQLYGFLSSLFLLGPSDDQVRRLTEILQILQLPPLSTCSLDDLTREYYYLFVVPNPRYVRPYESVYRDSIRIEFVGSTELGTPSTTKRIKGLLMGESTRDVARYYREAGVYPSTELPDHVGNELFFLGYLADKSRASFGQEAAELGRLYDEFRIEHPLRWFGKLKGRVNKEDATGYYRSAISVADALLRS